MSILQRAFIGGNTSTFYLSVNVRGSKLSQYIHHGNVYFVPHPHHSHSDLDDLMILLMIRIVMIFAVSTISRHCGLLSKQTPVD